MKVCSVILAKLVIKQAYGVSMHACVCRITGGVASFTIFSRIYASISLFHFHPSEEEGRKVGLADLVAGLVVLGE